MLMQQEERSRITSTTSSDPLSTLILSAADKIWSMFSGPTLATEEYYDVNLKQVTTRQQSPPRKLIQIIFDSLPSTDEILRFINWKGTPDQKKAILAFIISGLIYCGGLYVVQYNFTVGKMIMSAGCSGMNTAFRQYYNDSFDLKELFINAAISSGTTFIVCGSGYFTGSIMAIALELQGFTESAIMRASQVAGYLVGGGISAGVYIIVCKVSNEEVTTFRLVLSGISGSIEGSQASVVGAKAELIYPDTRPSGDFAPKELSYARRLYNYFTKSSVDPNQIRFSQDYVTNPKNIDAITESMRQNGWRGEAVDVVRMPDDKLTTFDNRRIYCARQAKIDAWVSEHRYSDPLPSNFPRDRGLPKNIKTWGDAVKHRISSQKSTSLIKNEPYGWFSSPYIMTGKKSLDNRRFWDDIKTFGQAICYLFKVATTTSNNNN